MTKQQKAEITKHIHNIAEMEKPKLLLFTQQLYLAKPDMDSVVFEWTLRGCDARMMELRDESSMSPLVVLSDLPTVD